MALGASPRLICGRSATALIAPWAMAFALIVLNSNTRKKCSLIRPNLAHPCTNLVSKVRKGENHVE